MSFLLKFVQIKFVSVGLPAVFSTNISSNTKPLQSSLTSTCDSVCISQMNTNSEFIGTITIMSEDGSSSSDGNVSLFAG